MKFGQRPCTIVHQYVLGNIKSSLSLHSSQSDDDLYMAECIQNSLRYDILQEKQNRQPLLKKSTSSKL